MLGTCVQFTWWIIDDESAILSDSQTIVLCSRATLALRQPLSFWLWYMLLFLAKPNLCFSLTQMSSDSLISLTSFFQYDQTNYLKPWHLFVKCKRPSMRHSYSRRKEFTVEIKKRKKNWPSDWELFLCVTAECAVLMCCSSRS